MSGSCRKTMERSEVRSRMSGSGNGAGSEGYRNRLERGADFRRSHDLDACYPLLCLRCRIFMYGMLLHRSSRICCGALTTSV